MSRLSSSCSGLTRESAQGPSVIDVPAPPGDAVRVAKVCTAPSASGMPTSRRRMPITPFGCSAQGPPKTHCVRGEGSPIREAKSCPSWFIWAMSHRISPSSGSRRFASRILRALARLPRRPLNTGSGVRSCTDRRRGVAGEEGALARAALRLRVFARVAPCSGKVGNKSGKAA